MNVKLKTRKRKKGISSLYLEYYMGYEKTIEGKFSYKRQKENLDLEIYTNPKNTKQREHNKSQYKIAEKVLYKRISEINENKFDIFSNKKLNTNLIEYFNKVKDKKTSSKSLKMNWINVINYLVKFCELVDKENRKIQPDEKENQTRKPDKNKPLPKITFGEVDEKFIIEFKEYLLNMTKLCKNTSAAYFEIFKEGLNTAFKENIIRNNPGKNVPGIKKTEVMREHLTLEEVQKLGATKCSKPKLKNAFLFACLTGLRWSDIIAMKWEDIEKFENDFRLKYRQQKTKSFEYMPLTEQSLELLGERGNPGDIVFSGLTYSQDAYYRLQIWSKEAGLAKKVTFHTARHTFATMQLTFGTDIYTVSKLLGHRFIRTTQIYAKIVDSEKIKAVNRIPRININD